ncbi:6086_t:CDS:2 [Entrophospora sp. SA101]|nr:6086_t:CDS:2 [Entrophospora sp. SA101]
MTLWELAYQRIPYKGKNLQDIQKHVTSNRREDTSPPHIGVPSYFQNYIKIITQMWKPDPDSRPDIVDLFNSLYDLLDKVKPDCSPLFSPIKNDEAIKASISINNNNKANNIVNGGNDDGDDPSFNKSTVNYNTCLHGATG